MLNTLLRHYPDEVALSWFIRFHHYSGNRNWRNTSEELFGKSGYYPNISYARHLGFFCNQIPSDLKIDTDYLIYNMTIFPFFKPFMPLERADRVKNGMVENEGKWKLIGEIGTYTGDDFRKEGRVLKICKACVKNDEKDYHESYIHRIHQIPGNFLCIKHNTPLSYFSVSNNKNNYAIDIDSLDDDELASYQIKPNLVQYYISLGEDIEFVLNGGLSNFSIDTVSQRYRQRLQEKGYVLTGSINQSQIISDFKQFYPVDFLESLEPDFDHKIRKDWLKQIIIDSRIPIHPIRHLLFIRFVFGGAKEFFNYSGEYKPFGNSPYPCLNRVADHYKQEIIQHCEIKRIHSIKKPMGIFKCDCGFVYSRQGPDKTEDDRHRYGRVLQYGHVWDDKLKELINGNFSIAYIAKEMKCYRDTVIKYATLFGIADKINTKQRIMPKKLGKKVSDTGLDVYRVEITQYIIDNPGASRYQIRKALCKQCRLLSLRDNQWLEENLPQPFKPGAIFTKDYKDKVWKQKDEVLLQKIKQIVRVILLKEKPQRITRTYIAKRISYYGIFKEVIKNLPRTEEYLLSCCETMESFEKRKILVNK